MALALVGLDLARNLSVSKSAEDDLSVSQMIRDDIFAAVAGQDLYFNGLAKTSRGYEPYGRISWEDYYTLDGDYGIGVKQIGPSRWEIVLLYNGAREISVNCDLTDLYVVPEDISDYGRILKDAHLITWHHPKKVWSYWNAIKTRLSLAAYNDDNTRKILQTMEKWEQTSWETCNWLKGAMNPPNDPRAEMHVAGKLWLWHDWGKETVTVGKEKHVWGEIQLRSRYGPTSFNRASPIRNGWLIEFTHEERYWLRWDGDVISIHPLSFPYGKWEKHGQWISWPRDAVVFIPGKGLVFAAPQFTIVGAREQHALSVWKPDKSGFLAKNEVIITNLSGAYTIRPLPFPERIKRVCAGSESMLFVTRDVNTYVLNMVDISDMPFAPLIHSALFRGEGNCVAYTIKSSPDVYAVIYQVSDATPVRILFIDAKRQVSLVPYKHRCQSFEDVFRTIIPQDNGLIVEMVDENGCLTGQTLKIGVKDKMGYISFPDGITTHYEVAKIEDSYWALNRYLSQHDSDT